MKLQYKNIVAVMAMVFILVSCSNDNNEDINAVSGTGKIVFEFDNIYGSANLLLNTQTNTSSLNEKLKITDLKYIVSNLILIKEDGSTYIYPKNKSYFIIDELDTASQKILLSDVPAGNYVGLKLGIGVDQEQFNLGATGQGDFLTLAQSKGMMWSWSAGYKFVKFEGNFTSATVTTETAFKVHTGKTGTDYNYKEITVSFPEKALVRKAISPEVHLLADASKIIDGINKISLTSNNTGGMGAMIMGGTNLPLITSNLSEMFKVDHVHN